MDIAYAVRHGMDSANCYRKAGPSPYHMKHPMFRIWWYAVVYKADEPWLGFDQVMERVKKRFKLK